MLEKTLGNIQHEFNTWQYWGNVFTGIQYTAFTASIAWLPSSFRQKYPKKGGGGLQDPYIVRNTAVSVDPSTQIPNYDFVKFKKSENCERVVICLSI